MTALITGASVGFGWATAVKFVKENIRVIALARREEKLKELQKCLSPEMCEILSLDVCDTKAIELGLKNLPNEFKNIDILVNNAGLALDLTSSDKAEISDWERMIEVNILSLVRLTRLILPQMVERKRGHIVNIGSIAGNYAYPGSNVYGASKAFVKQFSLNLRADLADKNIRITNIEPGLSGDSEFSLVRFKGDKARADSVYLGTNPLLSSDIAEAIFWAVSQPARVNINRIELMPTTQSFSALSVHKK